MQTDYIDLYQIHGNDSVTPVEETIRGLDILEQHGKVRYIGCPNWQAWKIAETLLPTSTAGLLAGCRNAGTYELTGLGSADRIPLRVGASPRFWIPFLMATLA